MPFKHTFGHLQAAVVSPQMLIKVRVQTLFSFLFFSFLFLSFLCFALPFFSFLFFSFLNWSCTPLEVVWTCLSCYMLIHVNVDLYYDWDFHKKKQYNSITVAWQESFILLLECTLGRYLKVPTVGWMQCLKCTPHPCFCNSWHATKSLRGQAAISFHRSCRVISKAKQVLHHD